MQEPVGIERIEEIVETVLLTACVRDAVPVSALLVAPSGTGKSKLLMRYQSANIHHTQSVTSQGLFQLLAADRENRIRFIVLPDLNPTLSRKSSTVQATMGNLLSVTTDGIARIDDGRDVKEVKHLPVGVLSACTREMWEKQARRWYALGIRRRFLSIFYCYRRSTIDSLEQKVLNREITALPYTPKKLDLNGQPRSVSIPESYHGELRVLAERLSAHQGKLRFREEGTVRWRVLPVVPVSPLITLQTLVQAHAIRARRGSASEDDIDFVRMLVDHTDPESVPPL